MEVLGKTKLRDEASSFTDWVKAILNEAYFELHENDFGFLNEFEKFRGKMASNNGKI